MQAIKSRQTGRSVNYTYLDATNDLTGDRLYNRARHKISSRFSYHPENIWTANLWVDSYLGYWFQPNAQAALLQAVMSCPQLITGIAGGVICWFLFKRLALDTKMKTIQQRQQPKY